MNQADFKFSGFQVERLRWLRFFESLPMLVLRWSLLGLGAISLLILAIHLINPVSSPLLAVALLGLAFLLGAGSFELYLRSLRAHPEFLIDAKLRQRNVLNSCDFAVVAVLLKWKNQPDLPNLLTQLARSNASAISLLRLGINEESLTRLNIPTPSNFSQQLAESIRAFSQNQPGPYSLFDLVSFVGSLREFQTTMQAQGLNSDQIANFFGYQQQKQLAWHQALEMESSARTGGFAKEWATSYTNLLDSLTIPVTPQIGRRVVAYPLYSRQKIVDKLTSELNKSAGQNILLVGEPGVGKSEVFYHLAHRIVSYQTHSPLDGYQVRILNTERLLAAATTPEALTGLFQRLFQELERAGNVILFIEHLEILLDSGGQAGTADASNLLESYLNSSRVRLIADINPADYVSVVKTNQLLRSRFVAVDIDAPPPADLPFILMDHLIELENRYQVFFTLQSLETTVQLAGRYIKDSSSPERELAILEEVASQVHSQSQVLVTPMAVTTVVEQKSKVRIQVGASERKTLLELEKQLHQRVVGQDRAVKQVSDALLRARSGLTKGDKPVGTFLFLGPTGVGKTETAKALAEIYFGSNDQLIRLDMTEYATENGLERLLGTDPSRQPGALTTAVQNMPSAVLLLDEIEKAHPSVRNVFLQLLDEGHLTTNFRQVLDFTNMIVIATSNAGSQLIKEQVSRGVNIENFERSLIDKLTADGTFTPELINRFDGVIVYSPLTASQMKEIVKLRVNELKNKLKTEKQLDLEVNASTLDALAERGYDPVFGARALQRIIQNELETAIARELITSQPVPGSKLTVKSL